MDEKNNPRANAASTRIDKASTGLMDPAEAGYREATDPEQRCEMCLNFDGRSACAKVAGPVDAAGVCDLFESATPMMPEEIPA